MDGEHYDRKPAGKADHHGSHPRTSPTDLLSSAKVIAEAAKAAAGRDMDKVDKAKVASAAEDVLVAASHYGKLEERGFGKYVQKAETYLHDYHTSRPGTGSGVAHPSYSGGDGAGHAASGGVEKPSAAHPTSAHHGQSEEGGSGYGDYMKLAQGFLKKPGHEGGQSEEGSGYGDYLKLAQDFLKKH